MSGPDSRGPPALLVVALFTRHQQMFDWACIRLAESFGPIALVSLPYDFVQTRYYEPTMGRDLRKWFLVMEPLVDPADLADIKCRTNRIEKEAAQLGLQEARPLNLDPGLLTQGKFMLATTKDQAHRIYLRDGIFAEVTLRFQVTRYEPWPWTYADYQLLRVREFLGQARSYYRDRLANA